MVLAAVSCTLCSCSVLLGTMSTCQAPLIFAESSCLFSLILNINLILHVNCSCQNNTYSVVMALLKLLYTSSFI